MPHAPVCFFVPSQALRHRPKAELIGGAAHRKFFLKVWLSEDAITQEMGLSQALLADEDGRQVLFDGASGAVLSVTEPSGKVVQASDFFARVHVGYDEQESLR